MTDDLNDILSDEDLFKDLNMDRSLFNNERYKRTVFVNTKSSQRKNMGRRFDVYKEIFDQVRADISEGYRQIKPFEDMDSGTKISKESPIKQGAFYIDNGVMLYIDNIYNPKTGESVLSSTNRNDKVHAIFENGTENHMKLLSLISSLYDRKRNGRFVTEKSDKNESLYGVGITTGYIYVVKYAGTDSRILNMENLYKIGFANDVKKRIANSSNEATYLFAPVKLVATFEIKNVDARKVETYIHHSLARNRVELSILSPSGKEITVKEWFAIGYDEIRNIINKMVVDIQSY